MVTNHCVKEAKDSTAAAGNLLKAPGLVALAAVFVLAAWHAHAGILLLAGLFLATAGLARLWNRLSLAGVRVERHLNGTRFFPGEPIACTLRLFNRKPLPLPWVQLENDLPAGFRLDEPVGPPGAVAIRRSASLLWYRGITWKLKLIGGRRGYYPISPLKITSGDFLGLYSRSRRAGAPSTSSSIPGFFRSTPASSQPSTPWVKPGPPDASSATPLTPSAYGSIFRATASNSSTGRPRPAAAISR